jgi:hypothetical protein
VIGETDPNLTPAAGLVLVSQLDRILGVVGTIDAHVGWLKKRRRGLSPGQVVVSMAECMLAGGDFMVDLDHLRDDEAGTELRAVSVPPASMTFADAARRFDEVAVGDLEIAMGALVRHWFAALDESRKEALVEERPTIDLDPTDTEVYGAKKQGVDWNYEGRRVGRSHPATWAEAGVVLAAELGSGRDDPRPQAPGLLRRALTALPEGLGRPRVRADAGLFDGALARAAVEEGADFAIAAKRNPAVWRAAMGIDEQAWRPAAGMAGAEVAVCDYAPAGWPEGTYSIVRRVRVPAEELRSDPRSRRRRTIPAHQLRLALGGGADQVYAYSFIVTNIEGDPVGIEAWFRRRGGGIEERLEDAKLGLALRHLPSGYAVVNVVWMWCVFLGLNLSVFCQSLGDVDADRDGRAHAKRARRELFVIPARICRHARAIVVRPAAGLRHLRFFRAWDRLRALPTAGGL